MWNDSRALNLLANTIYVLVVTAAGLSTLYWLVQRPVFALQSIELDGVQSRLQHVTPAAVRAAVAGRLEGNFFTVDLDQARQVFESVPWVRRASVRRQWPNGLVVQVEEQQAMSLWNENRLLNIYGEPFTANLGEAEDGGDLPALAGPDGAERLVAQRYAELRRWFEPLKAEPTVVTLSNRYAWQVELSNGLTVDLGREPSAQFGTDSLPLDARVTRLVQSLPVLESRLGRGIEHADLRYPNGFAVRAVPPPAPPPRAGARPQSSNQQAPKKPQ